jgi:hypothetical protein
MNDILPACEGCDVVMRVRSHARWLNVPHEPRPCQGAFNRGYCRLLGRVGTRREAREMLVRLEGATPPGADYWPRTDLGDEYDREDYDE